MSCSTMPVCKFFLKGSCRFGNNCKNQHEQASQGGFGQLQSQSGFGQPQSGFGQSGFGQPQQGFGQPQLGFAQPNQGFAQSSFGQPGFGQPRPGPALTTEDYKVLVGQGLWPFGTFEADAGISIEEYRLGGEFVERSVEQRCRQLGLQLETYSQRQTRPDEIARNRFYPDFIPREPLIVCSAELTAAM